MTSRLADLHFAPTEKNCDSLIQENISPEKQFDNVEARAKGKKGKNRTTGWMGPADKDNKG